MEHSNASPWTRVGTEVVDQRHEVLPSGWCPRKPQAVPRQERGSHVHESGRGRELARQVVELLARAREKAVVASFLLADREIEDAMMDASKLGVRVYVAIASEARLGREVGDGEFEQRVHAEHQAMLKRLGGRVLFRSAPHFHAKCVLIDPETQPAGLLLTANLTKEALERNEELAVVLSAQEVRQVAELARWAMWESAEHELLDPNDFRPVKPLGKVAHPEVGSSIVATTSQSQALRDKIVALVDGARSQILVSSFGFDAEHLVVQRLCARAREGLRVKVLSRVRPTAMPALLALAEAGAEVLGFPWLHGKAVWTDQGRALVMTANLQADGLNHGFELGVPLHGDRAVEVRDRLVSWCAAAPWRLALRPKLGDVEGKVQLWLRGKLVEVEVQARADVALGAVTAVSADSLQSQCPAIPQKGDLPILAHELHCSWTVQAPRLAAKAKEVHRPASGKQLPQPYALPVLREPDGRLVICVRSVDEVEQARVVQAEVGARAIVLADGVKP